MATRLKTVQYAFPTLASLTNNTLTNFTQITVYLPESGTKTIRKAWVEISMDDIITATGGSVTTKTVNLRLGAAGYTSTTNGNTLTNTGENISLFLARDFTSHFVTNWTGTSMTCDVQLQINQSTGTTLGQVNVGCTLHVTYEYDDTSTTHVKTVYIPLNAPVTTLPTTKTSHDTIPALDTYLPEASKTYRNIHIVTQANRNHSAATDHTVTYELSSLGTQVTGNYESALASDVWSRYVWNITSYITTNTTHTFNVWSSLTARHHSMQAWLVVTYEFNASTTTSVMNSLILPMEIASPMGSSVANFQRSSREFWIQESNVTVNKLAAFVFWQSAANEAGLNARIGTGSFVAYTNTGSGLICGNKGLMIRNDAPTGLTFGRGRNTLQLDIYNTSTTQRGGNVGAFWMVNYTSDVAADGVGSHNHTVIWPMYSQDTGAAVQEKITTADAINIPETNYFITALGLRWAGMIGAVSQGISINVERLTSGEGGLKFEPAYADIGQHDGEIGWYDVWAQVRSLFYRWAGDVDDSRLNPETNRRYVINSANAVAHHTLLQTFITYHSITSTVAGNITNSNGGTVTISLHRADSGEKVLETSRAGNGAYSFTWYDNTENIFVQAYEDDGFKQRSGVTTATLDT
jgi:hypothetical protein